MLNISNNAFTIPENDPNKFYVTTNARRWGAQAFCVEIEFKHFHPSKPELNSQFDCNCIEFFGELFFVIGVPKGYQKTVEKIASAIGMKVCNGIPTVMGKNDGDRIFFPLQGDNVWTLENRKRPFRHFTPYINEDMECDKIRNGGSPITYF